MRPTPPDISPSNSCGARAAECGLAAFRRLPTAAHLPSEQAVLARQEVSLGEIVLPNGFVLALSMVDARLGRKPALNMRLFDHSGRPASGPVMSLDHRRAKDAAEAYAVFLGRVVVLT
jgi:hypothetical protein